MRPKCNLIESFNWKIHPLVTSKFKSERNKKYWNQIFVLVWSFVFFIYWIYAYRWWSTVRVGILRGFWWPPVCCAVQVLQKMEISPLPSMSRVQLRRKGPVLRIKCEALNAYNDSLIRIHSPNRRYQQPFHRHSSPFATYFDVNPRRALILPRRTHTKSSFTFCTTLNIHKFKNWIGSIWDKQKAQIDFRSLHIFNCFHSVYFFCLFSTHFCFSPHTHSHTHNYYYELITILPSEYFPFINVIWFLYGE